MTYKRKVQLAYEIELYSDVDVQLTLLSPAQARRRSLRHRRPLSPPLLRPLRPPPRAVRDAPPRHRPSLRRPTRVGSTRCATRRR